jgi:hypothetical protein
MHKKHIETQNTNEHIVENNNENSHNSIKAVSNDIMENLESVRNQVNTLNAKTDTEL